MAEAFLEVRDVRKAYGSTLALDGVGFQVSEGDMFGLLGPNGAGKTTLLSIVSCLTEADTGAVSLQGRAVTPHDRDVRRLIGIVPQELAIYGNLTARENLVFFGQLYGLRGADLRSQVDGLLRAVGLEDRASNRAGTFSGGMKRRLNLAAGLVHRPRLLLLDEPTTGVDPQSRNLVFEEVRRVNTNGLTVVYTSHYMEEVQGLCTRIGIMDRGHLIACDTLAGLLARQEGLVRFRIPELSPSLREGLKALPECSLLEGDQAARLDRPGTLATLAAGGLEQRTPGVGIQVTLVCRHVKQTLLRLGSLLQQAGVEAIDLETQDPNLESVFLHLTGKALRD
jgi:ABC-2 type transport system ATP-binding protein